MSDYTWMSPSRAEWDTPHREREASRALLAGFQSCNRGKPVSKLAINTLVATRQCPPHLRQKRGNEASAPRSTQQDDDAFRAIADNYFKKLLFLGGCSFSDEGPVRRAFSIRFPYLGHA